METVWEEVIKTIQKKVPENTFDLWFKSLKLKEIKNGSIYLEVPNKFFRDWIDEHYHDIIMESLTLSGMDGHSVRLTISQDLVEVDAFEEPDLVEERRPVVSSDSTSGVWRQRLKSEYLLGEFVKGPSNEFAKAACEKVVENPARDYNPLFIYGGVGLGKTHLLNAIGNGILDNYPNMKVFYVTSEEFVNELVRSIRYEKMHEFQKKYRGMDVLLVDDIQFFAGKKQTQEEFFHTFNALYESQKQIVLTSDKITKEIAGLEERLRSRFEWGLIADIDYPDIEHMVAILKTKAEKQHHLEISDDVAFFIASIVNDKPNIRELEGMLTRLIAESSLDGSEITLDFARSALKNFIRDKDHPESIENIQKIVAKYYKLKVSDLKSQKRLKAVAEPRQIAMYLCKKINKASYPEIGKRFGGKDHSTVIHAVKKVERKINEDKQFRHNIFSIENQIKLLG
ncbi:MAG: chromosomal replication initiator protein DnaA [Deltaproteobacteria bacterium]|nr:chromosomal replication initiator protein DnaA [Candidatus Zymogenaceae bacterium]